MTERQTEFDSVHVRFVHQPGASEAPAAFGALGGKEVTLARIGAEHLASGGDFEPLGDGLLCFDAFGATHGLVPFVRKEREI